MSGYLMTFQNILIRLRFLKTFNNSLFKKIPTMHVDRYVIDRKKFITDLFVTEMREIYVHVYRRV